MLLNCVVVEKKNNSKWTLDTSADYMLYMFSDEIRKRKNKSTAAVQAI